MSISVPCPCGFTIHAATRHAGLFASCSACGAVLEVPRASEPEGVVPADGVSATALVCAVCGAETAPVEGVSCRFCKAGYHSTCWQEEGGCAVPTCSAGPRSRDSVLKSQSGEGHQVTCAACGGQVPTHAQRCRHCGEFMEPKMRLANKRRSRAAYPSKTSYLAGLSMLIGLVSLFVVSFSRDALPVFVLAVAGPVSAIGLGVWALRDIEDCNGEKSGSWTAGFGIAFGVLGALMWLMTLIG